MHRRRTATTATTARTATTTTTARATPAVAAVVGVLFAVPGLAGCGGSGLTPGTAAVLDGRRIPVDAVEARVAALRHAPGGVSADARWETEGLARRAVTELVLDAVVARAVADRGPAVADTEVAAARAEEERRLGGAGRLARELAAQGVPAEAIDDRLGRELGIRRLAATAGADADTPAGDAAVRRILAATATALHLRVNPRYGTWDPDRAALAPAVRSRPAG
ncbi:hypothetical protein [Kitasatospora purpeofusca]|uniref:hypothetical protein n=1 Tax=Kitasatospora purpeofusca TaxID=67352 RepID=UPI00224F2C35|nr:hypothetical protein [Kitasatospora purpeofusca]MCX4754592.1 hypothetical protein [Kitasatospora purpeofusca]WSR34001.1 hypothetical protein OG715_25295 [Kitasatospora purpeofusca]